MKNISINTTIPASPEEINDASMDEKKHTGFTGADAKIENRVGGEFEVWDAYATGKNIELIRGEKIVQSWRASDWPEDVESELTILLNYDGESTKLKLIQKNIPDEFADDVKQGWIDYYFEPLRKYFKAK